MNLNAAKGPSASANPTGLNTESLRGIGGHRGAHGHARRAAHHAARKNAHKAFHGKKGGKRTTKGTEDIIMGVPGWSDVAGFGWGAGPWGYGAGWNAPYAGNWGWGADYWNAAPYASAWNGAFGAAPFDAYGAWGADAWAAPFAGAWTGAWGADVAAPYAAGP